MHSIKGLNPGFRILFTCFLVLAMIWSSQFISCSGASEQPQTQVYPDRSPLELARLVAERHIHKISPGEYSRGDWENVKSAKSPEGIQWNYPWGVTLYGMLRTGDVLNDNSLISFVKKHNRIAADQFAYLRWQRETFRKYADAAGMEELMILTELDHCGAMTAQVLEGVVRHDAKVTSEVDELLRIVADYISNGQSRLPDGTLWRPEREKTIWGDDLYMSCPFLVRYAEYSDDDSYLDDAVKQTLNMASYLQDEDGVWFHGYSVADSKDTGFKWGRANGWAMVSTAEVLSAMPEDHPQYDDVLTVLRKHIEGILPLQAPSGLWRQVLDNPDLWEETSCTAMFTYVISRAVNRGWIDASNLAVAERAIEGLNQKITEEGAILDVCQGTAIGYDLEFYKNRERPFDDDHGHGAVLLALTEYHLATQD